MNFIRFGKSYTVKIAQECTDRELLIVTAQKQKYHRNATSSIKSQNYARNAEIINLMYGIRIY